MKTLFAMHACGVSILALALAPPAAHAETSASVEEQDTGARNADVSTIIVTGRGEQRSYAKATGVGSKVNEDPRDIPQSIAVISRQRLEDQNLRTSSEALAQIPGFNSTSPEGFFSLRGFSTGTSVDGAPSGAVAGRTDVDVEVFEQIEVLKGAAALLQGNSQPGGVVNYVFKKPTDRTAIQLKLGAGSFNNYYGGMDIGGPITADKSLRFRGVVFFEDRDLFTRPEYRQRLTMYGTLQYDIGPRTTASIGYHRQRSTSNEGFRQGLPTYTDGELLDVSPRTSLSQEWWKWTKVSTSMLADVEHRFGGDWIAKVAWRRGRAELPSVISYPGFTAPAATSACGNGQSAAAAAFLTGTYNGVLRGVPYGSLRCFYTNYYNDKTGTNSVDGFVSGSVTIAGLEQKLLLGYNRREDLFSRAPFEAAPGSADFVNDVLNPNPRVRDAVGLRIPENPAYTKTIDEGIYGRITLSPAKWLKIPVGGRFSWVTNSAGQKQVSGKFIPYAGVVADVTREVSLYASYVESFEPPSLTSFVFDPANPVNGGFALPPVSGQQFETGVKASLLNGRVQASAAYFKIKRQNTTSADPININPPNRYVILTGETTSEGAEAQINGEIMPGWSIGAAYAYTDVKVTGDSINAAGQPTGFQGQAVAMVPKHAFNLFTNYRARGGALDGFSIGGGMRAQSKQFGSLVCRVNVVNCTIPRIVGPGFTTFSLVAGYRLTENIDATLNVENLFNKKYWQAVTTRAGQNYLGSPRAAQITLRARY